MQPAQDKPWKQNTVLNLFKIIKKVTGQHQVMTQSEFYSRLLPSCHLLVQSQQWKYQSNTWNMFKVNNKNTRATSMTFNLEQNFIHCLGVSIVRWVEAFQAVQSDMNNQFWTKFFCSLEVGDEVLKCHKI